MSRSGSSSASARAPSRPPEPTKQGGTMTTTSSTTGFDFPAYRRALERFDVEALSKWLAGDAEGAEIDSHTPPASPRVLRGRDGIKGGAGEVAPHRLTGQGGDEGGGGG